MTKQHKLPTYLQNWWESGNEIYEQFCELVNLAISEEREACAKICEELKGVGTKSNGEDVATEFAAAIREKNSYD